MNNVATPRERAGGQALADAINQCRRAAAALQVAVELEGDPWRKSALREVEEQLSASLRALRPLS